MKSIKHRGGAHDLDNHKKMLLQRLQPPLRAAISSIGRSGPALNSQACLNDAFTQLSIRAHAPTLTFVRHASHAQQGAVNKAKDGPGKRLGAKKSGGESCSLYLKMHMGLMDVKSNTLFPATSSSANEAPTGSPATIAQWEETTRYTQRNVDM